MTEQRAINSLQDIRETKLETYANEPPLVSKDFKLEAADSADYSRRFVFELLQNADDEMPDSSDESRKIRFELRGDCLLVANTGRPFDAADLDAITTLTQTTKGDDGDEATIGHKGRGFTSILDITSNPGVFSQNEGGLLAAEFERERTRDVIEEKLREEGMEIDGAIDNVPLMPIPFPSEPSTRVSELLEARYSTVFRLPLRAENQERIFETIESTFREQVTQETVALLPKTDRVEFVVGERQRIWEKTQRDWRGETAATVIGIERRGDLDPDAPARTSEELVSFAREYDVPDRSFTGIDSAILEDIGKLRLSVAFRLEDDEETSLRPLFVGDDSMERPFVHVFLPTEERSPIPALLNGTFQVSTSRRSLNMPTNPETGTVMGLNGWLFQRVADLLAADVLSFVKETDTTLGEFLRTIDFTAVRADETARTNPVNRCFVEALRDAFEGVAFVPQLEQVASGVSGPDLDSRPLSEIVLPYTHPDAERLGPLTAMVYGQDRLRFRDSDADIEGWFPSTSLLEHDVATILEELGATRLEPQQTPAVLGAAPDENAILQYQEAPERLTVDPIVLALAETWLTLTDSTDKRRLAEAARAAAVFPVGDPKVGKHGEYYRHETTPESVECFFPPQQSVPTDALAGIRLFPTELYYTDGSRQADSDARTELLDGGEFESVLDALWDINEFGFQDIAEKGVFPLLPGPSSGDVDDSSLRDPEVLKFVQRLATSSTTGKPPASPKDPLPYTYRSNEPYYDLCLLPVPTADGGWARAYEVYFGASWQRNKPAAGRVEQLLQTAGVSPPVLAPPRAFGLDDADDWSKWREFFQWIGVCEHIRITPFFHPTQSHRYSATEHVDPGSNSTLDPDSQFSPSMLSEGDLNAYQTKLESAAYDAVSEDDGERPYIWQVNGLEYDHAILEAGKDPEFGKLLMGHLYTWWGKLSDHADATVALYSNNRLRYQTTYLFNQDEIEGVLPNLWLWQLRRASWLPSMLGQVPPEDAWLLKDKDLQRYSVDIDDSRHLLLPTLRREVYQELVEDTPGLLDALSIRRRVETRTLTPRDARTVAERIKSVVTELQSETEPGGYYISEIEAAYSNLSEDLPPLDNQGQIQSSAWEPAETGLGSVPVPCMAGDELQFHEASEAYFTRSHEEASRFEELAVPIFALTREDTPAIGKHFGMIDLVEAVDETPQVDEERVVATERFREEWLDVAAPYVLCRLKATRSSQREDATGLSRFVDQVVVVGSLKVVYELRDSPEAAPSTRPAEYFIERDEHGNRTRVYVVADSSDPVRDAPVETISKAFAEYHGLGSWESLYVLLQQAPDRAAMQSQLEAAGAPASQRELEARRSAYEGRAEQRQIETVASTEFDGEKLATGGDESTATGSAALRDTSSETSESSATVRDGSRVPSAEQLTRIGDSSTLAVGNTDTGGSSHSEASRNTGGDSGASSSRQTKVTANYIDKVDEFGMEATYNAELQRLREEGCMEPEKYVHDVHTRGLYLEARNDDVAGPVLEALEDRGVISKPYPGFDFLVVARDASEPERCIELKSSGSNTRRPSISWNEWKSARNEDLREAYYLYVAVELESGKSGDARLIQVPNPFLTLDSRERTVRSQSREVQVKLSEFHPEEQEVVERAIHWRE
ncbi:sacsin N-terminal ATP-binding-like domain-containing protein [Halorussus sp. AFM4]|uniref:sacsin N-terminal ATP-binding-like domain-containing protein n=1 Tax=Halorussus sp. AFM4 TaxID=3421651 RepID=UPI003EB87FFA